MKQWLYGLCLAGLVVCSHLSRAADVAPTAVAHANWVFVGMVSDENGEQYGYVFQMQREANHFHVMTALLNAQSKERLLFEEASADIADTSTEHWKVGNAFLRFNPINESWTFGMKAGENRYFNFKVDMLNTAAVNQRLRANMQLLLKQSGPLNGHLQLGTEQKAQFVTAKNAWFRQLQWSQAQQEKAQDVTGLLCRFNNGSGFYSMNLHEPDALSGAIAGWRDEEGVALSMSQFIKIKQVANGPWSIDMQSPKLHLSLHDLLDNKDTVAGFIANEKKTGFCFLSKTV
jgi:hypothetical protein